MPPRSSSSSSSTSRNAALACSTGGGVGRGAFQARVRPLGQNRGASSASSMAVRTNGNVRRVPHAGALDAKPPALIRADTERSQALVSRVKKRKFGGAGACALQFALSAAQQSAASAGFLAAAAASVSATARRSYSKCEYFFLVHLEFFYVHQQDVRSLRCARDRQAARRAPQALLWTMTTRNTTATLRFRKRQ